MASSASKTLLFLNGLIGLEEAKNLYLDEGSVNFYPIQDGYLQNYPGRTDYFDRSKGDPGATDTWGEPPALSADYTRVASFVDYLGASHLVFVKGNKLYETSSNGANEIATFRGDNISGKYYPSMFVHESKLVILNPGDYPMIWDGIDGSTPLGVQEVPGPPINVVTGNRNVRLLSFNPYILGNMWYHWKEGSINVGPAERKNSGGTGIFGWYHTVVQFVDKYGNHGRVSSPSQIFSSIRETDEWNRWTFNVIWDPPKIDNHIHFVRQGRTLTLNPADDSTLGESTVFHTEAFLQGTTCHRYTQRLPDSGLAASDLIDTSVGPPPSSGLGCSFAGRIWIVSEDNLVWYSDLVLFGQFKATQIIRSYSNITAIIPAGDRLFVIGESSTEVWFESNAGPALLEQDVSNGSMFGSSFVAAGDGVIFGLWNEGFGYYDGQKHSFVNVPYYLKDYYLKTVTPTNSAVKINDWYYLPIKQDQKLVKNNIILMFDFKNFKWFVVEDTVSDIAYWNEEIIGVDNSVYVLYRGNTFPAAILNSAGIVLSEINQETTVTDVRLLMEPSSFTTVSLSVTGEQRNSVQTGTGYAQPLKGVNIDSPNPEPYWDEPGLLYNQDWIAPGDVFLQMRHSKPVPGFYHSIKASFIAGHLVRVKAVELSFTRPTRPEQS